MAEFREPDPPVENAAVDGEETTATAAAATNRERFLMALLDGIVALWSFFLATGGSG